MLAFAAVIMNPDRNMGNRGCLFGVASGLFNRGRCRAVGVRAGRVDWRPVAAARARRWIAGVVRAEKSAFRRISGSRNSAFRRKYGCRNPAFRR